MDAVGQMKTCLRTAHKAALMGDHHLGYACPVGGVVAYKNAVSPSAVGFDIACGNLAVKTDIHVAEIKSSISTIMDDVFKTISFGVGRKNNETVDHPLFDLPHWSIPAIAPLMELAREQLGTVGSGNHYVDIFYDEEASVWIGVHFGSRGLGHKTATHFLKEAGGKDGIFVEPAVIGADAHPQLFQEYIAAMKLCGEYAYAGREWVCNRVAKILGAKIVESVHNHHNFAWLEKHDGEDLWVVRKGATPAFPTQRGFVGGTMGEQSVILEGRDTPEAALALHSTVHGAGRIMSRTEAAGKSKWKQGKKTRVSEGKVSKAMMDEWVSGAGVELRGAGVDESPHCYKRLSEVLEAHKNTINIIHHLTPIGVAMAGNEFDPYKD
jgi:tRNA-splicing ligase RtcB